MKTCRHTHMYLALATMGVFATGCSSTPTPEPEPVTTTEPVQAVQEPIAQIPQEPEPVLSVHRKTVYFEFDSAELTHKSRQELSELINQVKSTGLANSRIVISGHADATGPELYNDVLSRERAKKVESFLKSNLNPTEWNVESFGESRPVASNENSDGREQNRRVVVNYVASNKPLAMN